MTNKAKVSRILLLRIGFAFARNKNPVHVVSNTL